MARPPRVVDVAPIGARRLRIVFSDDVVRELDFDGALIGLLADIDDDAAFRAVAVDPVAGTLCWPGGIDLDPDVLHGDAEPVDQRPPRLIRQYRLQQAG